MSISTGPELDKTVYAKRNLVEPEFLVEKNWGIYKRDLFKDRVKVIILKCFVYSVDRFLKNQKILSVDKDVNGA